VDEDSFQKDVESVSANALFAAIIDSSEDAIVSKDLSGTITSWNKAAERIFGYSASEVIGGPISIIIPPEKGAEERDILQRIRRGETISHFETTRVRKNGERVEVSVTISPVRHEGRIVGASKIARDITAQKQLERQLAEQRARLEITLGSIGDAVIVADVNGEVTFMNRVAEALTGWTSEEAGARPLELVFNIINESTRRRVENPVAHVLREGTIVGLANHTILISKSGAEYAIDDSAAPIRDQGGEILGVVLVFRDVGGARAAADFRARLAAIVESSDDAIVSKDLNGRITSWNSGATKLFGYSAEEVLGRPISMLIPPDRLDEETRILEQIRRGEPVEHFESVRLAKDRRKVHVSLTISPIRDSEGHVIGASKIARDITDRKKAERELTEARAQLQKHSQELEKVVAERTAELRQALAQLEGFSYSISHDLRAPLRAMNGFADVVLKEHGPELRAEARELLERVVQSGKRLSVLVEEVLSSAQAKTAAAQLKAVSLSTLLPRIVEDYPNLQQHRSAIEIRQPLAPVLATEPLLTQCISNLLGNAIKFADPNRAPKINIWTDGKNGKVRLYIRDNGLGIRAEEQPHMFEMFSRGTSAANVEGTGVGLAIVKRAAERMGGRVGVVSTPDVGSEFWIELLSPDPGSPTQRNLASASAS
jgi:PAS domain S-box-containing protein